MLYLILLFVALFFLLAWRRLDWAVMFTVSALPVYLIRFSILGLPSTLLEVMIWAVFLVWFLKDYGNIFNNLKLKIKNSFKIQNSKFKIVRYPFDIEIILLLIVALASVAVAGFSASSLGVWKAYFFEPALFYIVAFNVIRTPLAPLVRGVEMILWSLAVSALAVSALAIYQKFTGQLIDNPLWAASATRRVVSFFGYPNAIGLYLGPLALLFTGWLVSVIASAPFLSSSGDPALDAGENPGIQKGGAQTNLDSRLRGNDKTEAVVRNDKVKIFFVSMVIILSILSIYFSKSKGALMGVGAGLVVFALLAGKKIRWAVVIAILIAAAGVLVYQPARTLAYNTVTFKTISGQIRLAGWRDSWRMLKDGRLISGIGLANFQAAVMPYHTPGTFIKDFSDPNAQRKLVFNAAYRAAHWQPLEIYLYPHNIILNFWSEIGLAGLLLFVWIIGKYFWLGISNLEFRISNQDLIFNDLKLNNSKFIQNSKFKIQNSGKCHYKYLNIGLICAMVVIVVHGVVDVPYFKNDLAVMFWLLVVTMGAINLESVNN